MTVGAYGILWGGETRGDLAGDWFTPETYLGARAGAGVDTMLHHGLPLSPALKAYTSMLLPATVKAEPDEHGLLVATILDRRKAFERKIYELTEQNALDWSSGAITRAVRRAGSAKSGEIKQWPIFEFSFTPTPCEPRMMGIRELDEVKSAPMDWFEASSYAKAVRVLSDFSEKFVDDELKFDARQPRDDEGKWSSGGGGISAGHAVAVMKHEGITDEKHHAAVREAIENGTHKTREEVLKHIDAIHSIDGKPAHEVTRAQYEAAHGATPIGSVPAHTRAVHEALLGGKYVSPEVYGTGWEGFAVTGVPSSVHPDTKKWIGEKLKGVGYSNEEIASYGATASAADVNIAAHDAAPATQVEVRKMGSTNGRKELWATTEALPHFNADGSHYQGNSAPKTGARLVLHETDKGSNRYDVVHSFYGGSSGGAMGTGTSKEVLARGLSLKDAKRHAAEHLSRVVGTEPGGKHVLSPKAASKSINVVEVQEEVEGETKKTGPFDFCSTQCNLVQADAELVRAWTKAHIPDELLADDGREDTPHITVLYGLTDEDTGEIQKRVGRFGSITAKVGDVDVFESDKYDVVILRVESLDLIKLRAALATLDHTVTHSKYQPHITLAYVQPGQGARFKGAGPLTGETLSFDGFAFSDKNGDKTGISTVQTDETKAMMNWEFDGQMIVAAALREACDRLCWSVLPEVMSPSTPPMQYGLTTLTVPTKDERLAYLDQNLSGFSDLISRLVHTVLDGRAVETPEEAVKTLRFEQKTSGERLPFADHSDSVLAAVSAFTERVDDLIALRSNSRKAGRVLSQTNFDRLSTHRSRLTELLDELGGLLDQHEPQSAIDDEPAPPDEKALDAQLVEAELRFKQMEFELSSTEMAAALD